MAIQNELDLDNKYQTSIDSELQKTTIKQPTVSALNKYTSAIKPTSVGSLGFESGNVVPLPKPTITAPELKPIQYTPEQQALVNSDMYKNIKAIAETPTATDLNTLSDNLNYIGDFASTLDDRVVSGLKSGVIGMPIQLAKLQEMSRSLAFNTVGLKSVISDEEFFATTNKFKEAGLKILQKDSSYIAQLNQDLQNKYADKNVFGATKFASEVAGTMVDMIPVIATNAVFGGGGMAVLYATASSRSIGEALNLGLNEDESITYGALMGGLEVATELMFNGIPMMETSKYGKWLTSKLDDQIASVIKSVSKNKVSQNVIKLLSNSIGEGFEEVVSEIVGFGIRAYYEVEDRISDKGLFSLETASNLAQDAFSSFLLGAISSIGMNVVHAQAMKVMESVANTSVIQNLNPAESTRLAEKIANNVLGYNYEQISLEEAVEKYGNVKIEERTGGFIDPNTNTIVVIDDGSGINPLTRTVFHEVAHALEITGEYKNLIAEVQSHMGEDYAQDVLKYVIDAGLLENNKEIIRSGLHSWDSEYIAEIIIQRSLFGESSGMRTSFVRKLANENPKLLERISDAVNNLKKKMIATQAKFDDDNIYPAQLAYVENLQRMFETAFRQYKETDEYLLKTQAKILGKEYETQETQQQKIIKSIDTLNPNEIIQTDNETVNDLYVMNRMIGTSIKENIAKIEATFDLNQFDMSNLFNLLYNMDEESANDNHMLMGAINSRFGKKLSSWFRDITELKNYQLSELLVFARNVHMYFDNAKEIDTYGFNEVSIKSLSDIFEEGVTDENRSSKIYESLQLIQDSINLKGVKYIGFGTKLDKELVVLHNITEDKLKSAFRLGGFASPSLAVTKADIPHGNFGDITIIFNKDILNGSPTYSSDGYTPRFPRVFLGMTSNADIKAFEEDIEKYRGLDGFDYLTNFVYNNQNAMFLDNDRTISRLLDTDAGRAIANDISGLNDDLKIEEEAMRLRMMARSGEITQQELDDYKAFSDGVGEARFKFIETFFKKYAQEYFRNNIETFTPSGNRKHPKYLLNEVTLENVVKYMKSHGDMIGKEYASISSLKEVKAMLSPTMKSVKDVIANKKLIGKLNSFDAIIDDAEQVLSFIGQQMSDRAGEEDILKGYMAGSVIDEIVDSRNITVENISRRFKNKGFYFIDEVYDDVEGIIIDEELKGFTYAELINKYLTDVRDLTVTYFESKPRRAVEFSEIQKILLPDYIEQSIIDTVEELGIPYEIYEFMPNNSNADGRLELIENDKSIQFQFINNAKTDSEGIELTPEQQTYFFNTKVLDDNKNLLRVRKDGILGYMNIQNLFDTTDRLNLTAIDAYNYESYKTITLDENGYLNESDAESLLSYLNINGYNFDGINFAVNGQVSYLPATNNQFKPLNDLNPVDVQEVQYQFKKVLETFDNVRGIEGLVQDLTFSNMKSWMDFGSKKEALDELQRYKDNVGYNDGSEKTLKYFDLIEDFIRTYDKNDNHDSDGNLITLAQLDLLKDAYSTKNNVPQVYYHGTDYDFDTFSFENIGETGIQDGLGFYFTQNARFAFKYSGESKQKLKEVYLNIKNPVGFGDYLTEETYKNYVNKIYELFNSMLIDYSNFTDAMMFDELFVRMGKSSIESAMKSIKESFIDNIYEYAVSSKGIFALKTKTSLDNFILNNIKGIKYAGSLSTEIFLKRNINDFMRSVQQAYIDSTGFDGLESNTAIVAFLPEQVIDINNKIPKETQFQNLTKLSTGEVLTDDVKSFLSNIAPIMINDAGEVKTVYHGTNHIFTIPLQDKSNGFYRFGSHNVMFVSTNPEVSLTYARGEMKIIDFKSDNPSGNIMKGYANAKNPLIIDCNGSFWNEINSDMISFEENNYSKESASNLKQISNNLIDFNVEKLSELYKQTYDFAEKYKNDFNQLKDAILNSAVGLNDFQLNEINKYYGFLNNKLDNFFNIVKGIIDTKSIVSYPAITNFESIMNATGFGANGVDLMLEAYFGGNAYKKGYKYDDFKEIYDSIKKIRTDRISFTSQNEIDIALNKLKYSDKLSTNYIVGKVLELIDKGLVTTDSVYFKNVKDFGGKNKLPSIKEGNDVIALIGESKFKDYQNENPTDDVDIQLQSRIPTTKYMEYQMNKIKELQESENIYIARMNITPENYNDNYEFLEYVKKIEDKQNTILTENDKKKIISQFKYQDDDIYKDHREYAKHSTNLYEERQKRKFIDAIVANIPYSRLRTTDNTSSVYLDVPVEFYDEIINRFGNKTIVPVNPRNLTSSTFTMRISDHDKLSENYSIPDVAIDVRDFGYVPLSMQENIKDSEEKDSNGNAISIGQALRFSKSRARDSKGNLIRYYLSIPLRDGQIVKAGSMLTTDRATSLKYIQTQYDFDMFERYGIEPTVYEVYLDRRNTFDTRGGYDMKVYNDLFMSKSSKHLELTKSGLPNVTMKEQLKKFLIDEGYDYDSFVVRDGEQDVIVTLMDGMAKGVDNKNPTYMPSRTQPEGMAVQHQSIYAPALTEEEKRELNNLKFLDSTAGILPMDAHYVGYNELLEKENKLVLYGGLLKLLKFKNWQGSDFSKEYAKIKRKFEKGGIYEHDLFKGYLQAVKGKTIKGVTKRTMSEWLYIARNFGMDYKATSEQDMLEQAIYAWLSLKPNTKDNLNRQGEKFVDFKVAKWVEEILKGATAGTMIDASEVTETVIPQIDELLEPEEVLKETPENYEEDAVLYEYVDESLIPPEMEEYFEPSLEDMNDFYTMMYVKDLLTKPVVDESKPIGTRKFPKTVLTSGNVSESLAGEVEVMLENGSFNYVIISDKEAMQRASESLVTKEDLLQAKTALYDKYINGQVLNKFDIARAELMMTRFSEFDVDSSRDILIILASAGTQYGQAIQALSLIKRMSASGQLKALEMIVKRMNSEYKDANRKYKGKNIEIKIKDEHIKELLQQIDKEDIENTVEKIKQDIADQIPATWYDKMNAWRYLSMLGNFKTHERNFLGNISMLPLRFFRDVFSETMQGVLPEEQRVKSIKSLFDAELFAFASDDFKNIESVSSSKYDTRNDIEKMRRIFDTNILHKASELNFKALEWEDVIFRKRHYIMSLVQYMGAKGLKPETITNDELIKARTFANEESKKMVFQQASKVANLINQFKRQHYVAGIAVDAIQPFVSTPINIAKTEAEYSPIGLLSGIVNMIVDIKNGEPTTKSLDKLSAGLTGSMFSLIGAMMYAMGFLNVGDDDDEQYKETLFKKMFGYQRYSLNILGGTYSLDWLTPVIVPLIIGGELYKYFEEKTEYNFFDVVTEETLRAFDPLLEMSMMSGIMNIMKSYKESPSASLAEIGSTMLGNFISQFVPTLSSQTAQTVYSGVSSTYAPSDSWSTVLEKSLRKVANKIPYVSSYINAPMIDIWGNPIEQADNLLARGLSNFLSVGYYKPDVSTKIDDEILRLYELTKNSDVIPDTVPKDFVNAGVKYIFDNQEYSDFSQNYGQTQYKLIGNMLESSDYYRLSSDEKASLADSLYKYAYADSKSKYLKSNGLTYDDGWYKGIEEAKQAGIDPVEYLLLKQVYNTMKSDSLLTKKERFINYLENTGRSLSMNKYLQYIGGYTVESDLLRNLK